MLLAVQRGIPPDSHHAGISSHLKPLELLFVPFFFNRFNNNLFTLKAAQLLVSDWLLETRTALWENEFETHKQDPSYVATPSTLLGFQEDLSSLKMLVQHLPVKQSFPTILVAR